MLTRVKCHFFPVGKTVDTGSTDQQTAKQSFKRLDQDNDGKLNKVSTGKFTLVFYSQLWERADLDASLKSKYI